MTHGRLSATSLAWSVGANYILLDLALTLTAGEWVALRGDNGTGKTTLLHILSGRIAPTAGDIAIDGTSIGGLDPSYVGRRIGWLGHKPGLYLDLTARENIELFAAVAGRAITPEDVAELLGATGLNRADHDRPVRHFSRGMKQRAALARVMVSGADIWLLDEPTTGLDSSGRAALFALLRGAAQRGVTLLSASHDQQLLEAADRVVELHGGCLRERRS